MYTHICTYIHTPSSCGSTHRSVDHVRVCPLDMLSPRGQLYVIAQAMTQVLVKFMVLLFKQTKDMYIHQLHDK